jgi:hypothetical protein
MHRDLLKYQPEKDPSMPKERTNLDQLVVAPRRLGISGAEMGAVDAWFFDRLQMFQGEWPTNVGLHNLGVSSFLLCIYIYIMHIYKYIYIHIQYFDHFHQEKMDKSLQDGLRATKAVFALHPLMVYKLI